MDDEPQGREGISTSLNLIGLGACLAAIFSSGAVAFLAGAVGLTCLVGSMAFSLVPIESPCERYFRECQEAPAIAADEPAVSPSLEAGHSQHWRQSVAATRNQGRNR